MLMEEKLIKMPDLEIRVLSNNIHIYKLADWSEEGLEQWEESVNERLARATQPVLSIYDMRHMSTISRSGFAVATRVSTHPKIDVAYSVAVLNNRRVAVLNNRRVAILVNTLMQMRRSSGYNRIYSNIDEAIEWLTSKL